MSEKRYYAHKHLLQNKVHDKICHNFMNIDETVEHMNNQYWRYKQLKEEDEQLNEENKELKEEIEKIAYANDDLLKEKREWKKLSDEYAKIYDENKKIKQQYSALEITLMNNQLAYNDLEKENEELKETINELRDIDKKDIEIEHINNIYKEFGFKGIIDYAKDKLQCYGAVREVDNGLWLLATGGWSDNEFWLDCLLNWDFMYAKGHYIAMTRGGGYYYTETPYEDIEIKKKQIKG